MKFTFNYCLPIYDKDKELVASIKEDEIFCLLEARNYNNSEFMGYNLILYIDGEHVLLQTYDYEEECTYARLEIEKAFEENRAKIYL